MYNTDLANLMPTLEKYGVAVLEHWIDGEEADRLAEEFINQLESLDIGLIADNSETWTRSNMPIGPRWGMYQSIVSHLKPMWDCRRHMLEIYQHIWGTPNIKFSLDGASIFPPLQRMMKPAKDWPHIDQTSEGFQCVQGQLVLTDTTASFVCTPKSHLIHSELLDGASNNWYKLKDSDSKYLNQTPIVVPKGSVILWDSRTIHSARRQTDQTWRCVAYVCARPEDHYTLRNRKTLKRALAEGRTTNHWGSRMFGKSIFRTGASKQVEDLLNSPERYMYKDHGLEEWLIT